MDNARTVAGVILMSKRGEAAKEKSQDSWIFEADEGGKCSILPLACLPVLQTTSYSQLLFLFL